MPGRKLTAKPKPPTNQKSKAAELVPVQRAVEFMIEAEDYKTIRHTLLSAVKRYEKVPVRFDGVLAVLNPLVDLGIEKPASFERVLDTIVLRRREVQFEKESERQAGRKDYMRDYMREYRRKIKRARINPPSKRDIKDDVAKALKED
jgi:hypothetical protein